MNYSIWYFQEGGVRYVRARVFIPDLINKEGMGPGLRIKFVPRKYDNYAKNRKRGLLCNCPPPSTFWSLGCFSPDLPVILLFICP